MWKNDLIKKKYDPFLWMGFYSLKARATSRRQFQACKKCPEYVKNALTVSIFELNFLFIM